MIGSMPGTNLTRDEAAPAPPSWTSTRTPSSSTSRAATDFASTTTIGFSCAEPGRHLRRPGRRDLHEITLNGATLDASRCTPTTGSPCAASRRDNELVVTADLPYTPHRRGTAPLRRPGRRPGLPLHPVRGPRRPSRLHRPSSSPTSRRRSRSPSPPRRTGRWSPTPRRPSPSRRGRGHGRSGTSPPTEPMSTYITALVAGEYHEVRDNYEGAHGTIPLGHYCRQSIVDAPRRRGAAQDHQAGLRLLRGRLRLPLPLRQVRPALRAGVQHGRDGERGLRDLPRRVPPPLAADPRRSTSSAPTRSCTRWRTCGSATSSP